MGKPWSIIAIGLMILGCGGLATDGPPRGGDEPELLPPGQVTVAALSDASCTDDWDVLFEGAPGLGESLSLVGGSILRRRPTSTPLMAPTSPPVT